MRLRWIEKQQIIESLRILKQNELKNKKEPNEHEKHLRAGGRIYIPDPNPYKDRLIDFSDYARQPTKDGA